MLKVPARYVPFVKMLLTAVVAQVLLGAVRTTTATSDPPVAAVGGQPMSDIDNELELQNQVTHMRLLAAELSRHMSPDLNQAPDADAPWFLKDAYEFYQELKDAVNAKTVFGRKEHPTQMLVLQQIKLRQQLEDAPEALEPLNWLYTTDFDTLVVTNSKSQTEHLVQNYRKWKRLCQVSTEHLAKQYVKPLRALLCQALSNKITPIPADITEEDLASKVEDYKGTDDLKPALENLFATYKRLRDCEMGTTCFREQDQEMIKQLMAQHARGKAVIQELDKLPPETPLTSAGVGRTPTEQPSIRRARIVNSVLSAKVLPSEKMHQLSDVTPFNYFSF